MEVLAAFRDKILYKYEGRDYVSIRKARVFLIFTIVLSLAQLFLYLWYAVEIPERLEIAAPAIFAVGTAAIVALVLLVMGYFYLGSHILLFVLTAVVIVGLITKLGSEEIVGFTTYPYLMISVLIFAALFAWKRFIFTIAALFLGALIFYYYRAIPVLTEQPLQAAKAGMAIITFSILLSSIVLSILRSIMDTSLEISGKEAEKRRVQVEKMQRIIQSTQLTDSLSKSSEFLHQMSVDLRYNATGTVKTINKGMNSLTSAGVHTEDIALSAKTQKEMVGKAANSLNEVNDSLAKLTDKSIRYESKVQETSKEANFGVTTVRETLFAVSEVKSSTDKIENMNITIQQIAEKVNMLSLNASIEAARAGQYGRGFAVVAEEISKLAERTTDSASTISELVAEEIEKVDISSDLVNRLAHSFLQIADNMSEVEDFLHEISTLAKESSEKATNGKDLITDLKGMASSISDLTDKQIETKDNILIEMKDMNKKAQVIEHNSERLETLSREIRRSALELNTIMERV
ncbi:MAG: methyl-accepting chemotaxis protein [Leptospirales bacterium]